MTRYLLVGDIHLSDRPPSSCFDSYQDDIFDLLAQTMKIAKDRDCRAIIWAGDVFHHKTPGRTSHATLIRLIDLVQDSGVKHYVVPGNHDLLNDRLASITATQPLGVVVASGAVELLNGWMSHEDNVFGVPWLMRFDDDTVNEALLEYLDRPGHGLVVTHAPLYPPGQENPFEHYPTTKWAEAMGRWGSVYYGHVHDPAGVYTVGDVNFCNPGALSRGSLHEYNLTRTPSCAIWDSETGEFEIVELIAKPPGEVFKLAEAAEKKQVKVNADAFLASIRETRVQTASVEVVVDQVRGMQLDPDVEELVVELLEQAQ